MALAKKWDKSNWSLIFERPNRREKKRRGKERRGRGREEEEKRRGRRSQAKRYGTMTINMNTCFGLYGTTLDKDFFN